MIREKTTPRRQSRSTLTTSRELVLFNDEVNTFDFVISTLIEVCRHEPNQAEQCALIAHYKGKCGVLTGTFAELSAAGNEMTRRGLTVEIH